ncbi:hypothetical protein BJV78DRAFT_1228740 [Lactifluus subvellereus]|nr:hypothetical protein BJV78DRAFT_1228740 [Lactifluus subvellereus]
MRRPAVLLTFGIAISVGTHPPKVTWSRLCVQECARSILQNQVSECATQELHAETRHFEPTASNPPSSRLIVGCGAAITESGSYPRRCRQRAWALFHTHCKTPVRQPRAPPCSDFALEQKVCFNRGRVGGRTCRTAATGNAPADPGNLEPEDALHETSQETPRRRSRNEERE